MQVDLSLAASYGSHRAEQNSQRFKRAQIKAFLIALPL